LNHANPSNRDVEGAGLSMCFELLNNIAQTDSSISNAFYQTFFLNILQDVFFVLSDSDHKAGFKQQSLLLARMFDLVEKNEIQAPLYTPQQAPEGTSNADFLKGYVSNLLKNAFPHLQANQIEHFVQGLFTLHQDHVKFKLNLRDFLIQLKEFGSDNADLYAEEREDEMEAQKRVERERAMKVGGLIKPSDMDEEL